VNINFMTEVGCQSILVKDEDVRLARLEHAILDASFDPIVQGGCGKFERSPEAVTLNVAAHAVHVSRDVP
jgi:hypothetical protein